MTTELEDRLRALRGDDVDDPGVPALRRRAAGRRRRRRGGVLAAGLLAVTAGAAVVVDDGGGQDVATTPSTTTTTPNRVLGDLDGVRVEVSPRAGLADGDLVEVRVEGVDRLPGALVLQCAGDITERDAATACDLGAVHRPSDGLAVQVPALDEQVVSVARTIQIARGVPEGSRAWDCATEPAGCVLAVAPFELPARGVLVPLTFVDDRPLLPTSTVEPTSGLADGQAVAVRATGLRPNGSFVLDQCTTDPEPMCGEVWQAATTDDRGDLDTTFAVAAAIYGHRGRVDCTAAPCEVAVRDAGGTRIVGSPVGFAAEVVAPVPRLALEPSGPYADGQEVTVTGSGFPPGRTITTELAQCPVGVDPAVEDRCGYPLPPAGVVVDDAGSFTTTLRLSAPMCVEGCVLAWVVPHGPTVASAALPFLT